MTNPTLAKKDTQKLQRAIVDGLEDVKAQDIQVFDTEHLSALFERVIIASGTSNRQTKGLAASVVDAVRDAGFVKPRVEGEDNGEWIIVDCGQAVVHIMQPSYRSYYNLEELWGDKPVRLRLGAAKPAPSASSVEAGKPTAAKPEGSLRRSSAAKKGVAEAFPSKAQLKKDATAQTSSRKTAAKTAAKTAQPAPPAPEALSKPPRKVAAKKALKAPAKVLVVNAPVKPATRGVAKKAASKKVAAKKTADTKSAARKA